MSVALLKSLRLDRQGAALHRQLADGLRDAILDGEVRDGDRLPSSRGLAAQIGVSRNTVIAAYDQLVGEGFLTSRVGDGTRVSSIKLEHLATPERHPPTTAAGPFRPGLSATGCRISAAAIRPPRCDNPAFITGLPALDEFPHRLWARIVGKAIRDAPPDARGYTKPGGHMPLRETIARHLNVTRGVQCTPEQVMVTTGAQAALDFIARMLLDTGDQAWIEDPGYLGARGAIRSSGATLLPVRVDDQGLDPSSAATGSTPKLIYVTPSYQFPLGVTMSLPRRLSLLEFAYDNDAWILEDDYDSDFRYQGRPLAALQGLDSSGRVLYTGTFSKTMFPTLRVGYMVVPRVLVEPFHAAMRHTGQEPPAFVQAALQQFMSRGYYRAHARRMNRLYERRQQAFIEAVRRLLDDYLDISPRAAGMQLVALYRDGMERPDIEQVAAGFGVNVKNLCAYCLGPCNTPGLFLGYAGVPEQQMSDGAKRLRLALDHSLR